MLRATTRPLANSGSYRAEHLGGARAIGYRKPQARDFPGIDDVEVNMHDDGAAGKVTYRNVLDAHLPHVALTQKCGLGRIQISGIDKHGAALGERL